MLTSYNTHLHINMKSPNQIVGVTVLVEPAGKCGYRQMLRTVNI